MSQATYSPLCRSLKSIRGGGSLEAIFGRIGFIGAGAMAEGLMRGLIKRGVPASAIWTSDISADRLAFIKDSLGVNSSSSNIEVAGAAATVILAVKPQVVQLVLSEISKDLAGRLVISIAAGVSIAAIARLLPPGTPVVRAMPNTPCMIGRGAIAIAPSADCQASHTERARSILASSGTVVEVTESQMDAVTGLSGSGPAYVFTFIEALIDAGVKAGLGRSIARQLAIETVIGSAELLCQTGSHPAVLRDSVTSPGGTTIEAMGALERGRFRATVAEAVTAAVARSAELGRIVYEQDEQKV